MTHDDPATIRANLARAHREAAEAADRGDDETYLALVALADVYERRLAIRGHRVLTSEKETTTLQTVDATENVEKSFAVGRGRSRALRSGHPWVVALYSTDTPKKKRMTVTAWAKKHGVAPASATAWVAPRGSDRSRKIPIRYAEAIEREYGLAANESTWPQGLTD